MAFIAVSSMLQPKLDMLKRNTGCAQIGIPYIRAKAQDYYEELGGGASSDIMEESMGARQLSTLSDLVCYQTSATSKTPSTINRVSVADFGAHSRPYTLGSTYRLKVGY